jgi:hypothetical protein
MAFNLNSFRRITNGFARGHHFNLGIVDFKGVGSSQVVNYVAGVVLTPLISIFCSSTTLPSKIFQSEALSIQHGLPPINMASSVTYGPWSVTFYSDELAILRTLFLRWQEKINNTKDMSYGVPAMYKSQLAYASLLSPQDIPVQVYSFYGLYPSDIQGITLSQMDTNVLQFTVDFTYDYFQVNEARGYIASLAHEIVFDTVLGKAFDGTKIRRERKRSLNAPYGLSIKLPF